MKEVRFKIKLGINEETKQSLINQGREDALKSFQNMFGTSRESFRRKFNSNTNANANANV